MSDHENATFMNHLRTKWGSIVKTWRRIDKNYDFEFPVVTVRHEKRFDRQKLKKKMILFGPRGWNSLSVNASVCV